MIYGGGSGGSSSIADISSPHLTLTVTNGDGPEVQIDLNETFFEIIPAYINDNTYNLLIEDNYLIINASGVNINLPDPALLAQSNVPNQEYMIVVHPDASDISIGIIGTPQPKFIMNGAEVASPIVLSAPGSYIKAKCLSYDPDTGASSYLITDFGSASTNTDNSLSNTKMVRDDNGSTAVNELYSNAIYSESVRRDNIQRLLMNVFNISDPAANPVGINASDFKIADVRVEVHRSDPSAMSSGVLEFDIPINVNLSNPTTWVNVRNVATSGTPTGLPQVDWSNATHKVTLIGGATDNSAYQIMILQNTSLT